MSAEDDVDVIVVGSGGCGLAAGLAAADAGASAVVLEKMDTARGNTYVSTGSIPGAGTKYQREAGIEDDSERFEADLLRQSGPTRPRTSPRCSRGPRRPWSSGWSRTTRSACRSSPSTSTWATASRGCTHQPTSAGRR